MAKFSTVHTERGLRKLNAARLPGSAPVYLAQMAFGDGNGNPVEPPSEKATGLVRECYRTEINSIYQDPDNELIYYAEAIIPVEAGGFVIREMSIIDSDGDTFAIANTPDNYQPVPEDGAVGDGVYRMAFAVSNAGNVTIALDPNAVVASRQWVINYATAGEMLPGGTTGQVATKGSNADGDIVWRDAGEVNVLVNSIEERQTLAAGQRVVDLAITTTVGLAVYINGQRIARGTAADEWMPDTEVVTRLELGSAYPAGTRLIAAQNEPAGNLVNPLDRSANLADVPDKAAARRNLDILSRAETQAMSPPGMVGVFAGQNAPTGWLKANGAQVPRAAYPELWAAVGDMYTPVGAVPAAGSFFLPDLRGLFPRFADDGKGRDPGRAVGSVQGDQFKAHAHSGNTGAAGEHSHDSSFGEGNKYVSAAPFGLSPRRPGNRNAGSSGGVDFDNYAWETSSDGAHAHPFTTDSTGGSETRPVNVALLACIKY